MISLEVNQLYVPDLHDDFIMNENLKLFQFIDKDPIKAFYLGMYVTKWWDKLDKDQMYLHSKELRHNGPDYIAKYQDQIEYWSKKYDGEEDIDMIKLAEFLLNNIFYQEEDDQVRLALHLGMAIGSKIELENDGTDETGIKTSV